MESLPADAGGVQSASHADQQPVERGQSRGRKCRGAVGPQTACEHDQLGGARGTFLMRSVMGGETATFPATSVARAMSVTVPFAIDRVSKSTKNGGPIAKPIEVDPTKNSTLTTAMLSVAVASTVMTSLAMAFGPGSVM